MMVLALALLAGCALCPLVALLASCKLWSFVGVVEVAPVRHLLKWQLVGQYCPRGAG
jgi:hypothetical protein